MNKILVKFNDNLYFQKRKYMEDSVKQDKIQDLKELLGRGRAKQGMSLGNLNEGELEIGQVSGLIEKIMPAADVVQEILKEYRAALRDQRTEKYTF